MSPFHGDAVLAEHPVDRASTAVEASGCERNISTTLSKGLREQVLLVFLVERSVARKAVRTFVDHEFEGFASYLLAGSEVDCALD